MGLLGEDTPVLVIAPLSVVGNWCDEVARFALDGMVAPAAVPTLRAMSGIYRGILRRIARDPRSALASRVRLSALEKSWIALRARLGLLGAVP